MDADKTGKSVGPSGQSDVRAGRRTRARRGFAALTLVLIAGLAALTQVEPGPGAAPWLVPAAGIAERSLAVLAALSGAIWLTLWFRGKPRDGGEHHPATRRPD